MDRAIPVVLALMMLAGCLENQRRQFKEVYFEAKESKKCGCGISYKLWKDSGEIDFGDSFGQVMSGEFSVTGHWEGVDKEMVSARMLWAKDEGDWIDYTFRSPTASTIWIDGDIPKMSGEMSYEKFMDHRCYSAAMEPRSEWSTYRNQFGSFVRISPKSQFVIREHRFDFDDESYDQRLAEAIEKHLELVKKCDFHKDVYQATREKWLRM